MRYFLLSALIAVLTNCGFETNNLQCEQTNLDGIYRISFEPINDECDIGYYTELGTLIIDDDNADCESLFSEDSCFYSIKCDQYFDDGGVKKTTIADIEQRYDDHIVGEVLIANVFDNGDSCVSTFAVIAIPR